MRDELANKVGNPIKDVSLQVQTIVYCLDAKNVFRTVECLARSFELAKENNVLSDLKIRIGDTSPDPCLTGDVLRSLVDTYAGGIEIDYYHFGHNLGSAGGHNALSMEAIADYLMILNPDVVVSPRLLEKMIEPFAQPSTGMTEARQIPIEHPKDYNPTTGETGWATTACAITPRALFEEIGRFDAESFFLYCDDVDYSWRVREAGKKVIYLPQATAFHDKQLGENAEWQPSGAEVFYSAQAALLMAHKWSRVDMLGKILRNFEKGSEQEKAARRNFLERKKAGTLPAPRDAGNEIGEFTSNYFYTNHRYDL